MARTGIRQERKTRHGGGVCWAARIISLLPGVAALMFVLAESIQRWTAYGSFRGLLLGLLVCFIFLLLPALIAWRWHGLGGLVLMGWSSFHILWIAASMAEHSYGYFELDRLYVLRVVLPGWITMLVGGCLHLLAWGNEHGQKLR